MVNQNNFCGLYIIPNLFVPKSNGHLIWQKGHRSVQRHIHHKRSLGTQAGMNTALTLHPSFHTSSQYHSPMAENTTKKGKVLLSNTVLALNKALELSKKLELYVGIEVQGILIYNHM